MNNFEKYTKSLAEHDDKKSKKFFVLDKNWGENMKLDSWKEILKRMMALKNQLNSQESLIYIDKTIVAVNFLWPLEIKKYK